MQGVEEPRGGWVGWEKLHGEAEFMSAVWSCGLRLDEGLFWFAELVLCWFSWRVLALVLEV